MSNEELTVKEAGRNGGNATKAKYGNDFYREIGKKGGRANVDRNGPESMGEAGRKGGKATSEKYGHEFYQEIGKKGGQRIKELIAKGKESENERVQDQSSDICD